MERGHRPAVATFFADAALTPNAALDLDEAAAHHARVRRLEPGDAVRLTNGRGTLGAARIQRLAKSTLSVHVDDVSTVASLPCLRLLLPVADRDRMLWLAEKCTELGVSVWQPVAFSRSASVSPRGEGDGFERKVRARMTGALEQSGGAWLPEVRPSLSLADALVRYTTGDGDRYLLEQGGLPLIAARPHGAADLLVGPEGGIDADERLLIVERYGWISSSLGDTTLRFETAGVVGLGVLRGLLREA